MRTLVLLLLLGLAAAQNSFDICHAPRGQDAKCKLNNNDPITGATIATWDDTQHILNQHMYQSTAGLVKYAAVLSIPPGDRARQNQITAQLTRMTDAGYGPKRRAYAKVQSVFTKPAAKAFDMIAQDLNMVLRADRIIHNQDRAINAGGFFKRCLHAFLGSEEDALRCKMDIPANDRANPPVLAVPHVYRIDGTAIKFRRRVDQINLWFPRANVGQTIDMEANTDASVDGYLFCFRLNRNNRVSLATVFPKADLD